MRCDDFERRLNEVLDNRDRPEKDSALQSHALACVECGELIRVPSLARFAGAAGSGGK